MDRSPDRGRPAVYKAEMYLKLVRPQLAARAPSLTVWRPPTEAQGSAPRGAGSDHTSHILQSCPGFTKFKPSGGAQSARTYKHGTLLIMTVFLLSHEKHEHMTAPSSSEDGAGCGGRALAHELSMVSLLAL